MLSNCSHVQLFSNPMDYSPSGFSVHGILQARILEWVAMYFSSGSSQLRDQTQVSSIAVRFFTILKLYLQKQMSDCIWLWQAIVYLPF